MTRRKVGRGCSEDIGEGGQLDLALLGQRDGKVAEEGEVNGEPHDELVVDVPVPANVFGDTEEEVVRHHDRHVDPRLVVGPQRARVRHRAGSYHPAEQTASFSDNI